MKLFFIHLDQLRKKNKGQSTVEFILSFSSLLLFIFFIAYFIIHLSGGYLIHYAVFKASRAYLTADTSPDINASLVSAEQSATEIFNAFKIDKRLGLKGKLEFNSPINTNIYEYVGPYYTFTIKPFSLGPFGVSKEIKMISESFLGKEPTESDCACQVLSAMGKGCENQGDQEMTLFDNGC